MAPRKAKAQGKRNNVKIKSKVIPQKRGLKSVKKAKEGEKPLEKLKWLDKLPSNDRSLKKCSGVPEWLSTGGYKHEVERRSSEDVNSDYGDYQPNDAEEKSTISEMSEECNCSLSKYSDTKGGILKRKTSSTNSIVARYIKSGMDHVASFIVESAIRFGEQHGVVIPDKNTPNVYEITPPDKFDEKFRKIRFKIPDKSLGYEDAKKVMWRSHQNPQGGSLRAGQAIESYKEGRAEKAKSRGSSRDSLEDILPLLEKLKDEKEIIKSDLDLEKLKDDVNVERRNRERDRDCDRDRDRDRDKDRDKDRDRDLDRERDRERGRHRERLREKFRLLGKRFKSLGPGSGKNSTENEYALTGNRNPWKKFKRDSVELGRQRLRASTCPRKPGNRSLTPY